MGAESLFRVSFSKVATFERCRKQYWFKYVSGEEWPDEVRTPAGVVGNGVHRAMHVLCQTDDRECSAHELDAYLRMPIHACAGPGTEAFRDAFAMLERGWLAHDSIPSDDRWAELETWAPRPAAGVNIRARLDRLDRLGRDEWQVLDWKTGRFEMPDAVDAQLDLGHVAARVVRQLPRTARVRATAWNLRTGEQRVRELTRDDAAATLRKYTAIGLRMQSAAAFEATPSPACNFCAWRERCAEATATEGGDWEWLEDDAPEPEDAGAAD